MRRKIQKVRCTKIKLDKCKEVCRLYDKVQESFARLLSTDETIVEFATNVPLDFSKMDLSVDLAAPKEAHTTDFLIRWKDGTQAVREAVLRATLHRPSVIEKLQISKEYWNQKGVSDWGIVIEKETESKEEKEKNHENK